jgi:hypothetical protein
MGRGCLGGIRSRSGGSRQIKIKIKSKKTSKSKRKRKIKTGGGGMRLLDVDDLCGMEGLLWRELASGTWRKVADCWPGGGIKDRIRFAERTTFPNRREGQYEPGLCGGSFV